MSRPPPFGSRIATNLQGTRHVAKLTTQQKRFRVIDVGPNGHSPGDYVLFEESVSDRSGMRIGSNSVRCMTIIPTTKCDGTFAITGKGTINVAGS